MSKQSEGNCHRCGHVVQPNGREFKCPKCGLVYNKYSPCLNERHGMGELGFEPADEGKG
jgi:tRNA(Ile2) C34 agmatinyltransferase TiaS